MLGILLKTRHFQCAITIQTLNYGTDAMLYTCYWECEQTITISYEISWTFKKVSYDVIPVARK